MKLDIKEQEFKDFPNIDFLGCGYNILEIDPTGLDSGSGKKNPVFNLDEDTPMKRPVGQEFLIPEGTFFSSIGSGKSLSTTAVQYTAYEYKSSFNISLGFDIGIDKLLSSTLSAAFQHFEETIQTTTSLQTYTSSEYQIGNIEIRNEDDQSLKLTNSFITAIEGLDTTFDKLKPEPFYQVIEKFGTHYSKQVTFGGRLLQEIFMTQETYQELSANGFNIKQGAKGTFEGITVGKDIEAGIKNQDKFNELTSEGQTNVRHVGGKQNKITADYVDEVEENPGAVNFHFEPLSALLTPEYMTKNIDQLAQKQEALSCAIKTYCQDNGEIPERFSNDEWLIYNHRSTDFDVGVQPSVAAFDDGRFINVNKGTADNQLFYQIGNIDCNLVEVARHSGTAIGSQGTNPCVAVLNDDTVIQMHSNNNKLYYQIGKVEAKSIAWTEAIQWAEGNNPAVEVINQDTVIAVFFDGEIRYQIGKITKDSDTINWQSKPIRLCDGNSPDIAILNNEMVCIICDGASDKHLFWSFGQYSDGEINWLQSEQQANEGKRPSLSAVDTNSFLLIFDDDDDGIYYRVGRYNESGQQLIWLATAGTRFATGDSQGVDMMPDGKAICIHNNGHKLFYRLGKMA